MTIGAEPLLLVGAGKMGGAMLERWLEGGLREAAVLDPFVDAGRRTRLERAGVTVAPEVEGLAGRSFRTIVVAVKPQSMSEALPSVAPLAGPETVIVSVAAGIRLARLEAAFPPGQPVIRAMPNTPAQIGQGMSVAIGNAHVEEAQKRAVDALLAAIGDVAWIDDEALIDAVTAVSGSGPAYVFLLAECLARAGIEAGLPDELAARLARQTVVGGGALLGATDLPAATLRENVTSPNGTTAAALSVLMEEAGLQSLLTRAVAAAKKRSIELG